MVAIKSEIVIVLMCFCVSNCQRKIMGGDVVSVNKTYVVYLVKAAISRLDYDNWLCGGAIVTEEFVITSAACVNDVDYVYVIAGYNKYVPDLLLETDNCTKNMKKKIVYTCSPKDYVLKYEELDYWSGIDIALAKVESKFGFKNNAYLELCSYKPSSIPVNYDPKYQEAGTDSLVLGWGHKLKWRKPMDKTNYNEPYLRYAPTLILNKTHCMEHFLDHPNISSNIDRYMICTLGKGNLNDKGEPITKTNPVGQGCTTTQMKVLGFEGLSCEFTDSGSDEDGRRSLNISDTTNNDTLSDMNYTSSEDFIDYQETRRTGICQNDHGGPLITFVGASEILIGVASVFKVSEESQCMGPFLYTSTYCTGLFLDCVLNRNLERLKGKNPLRQDLCDQPASEKGFDTVERHISWKDHPAGPADNERTPGKLSKGKKKPPQKAHKKPAKIIRDLPKPEPEADQMITKTPTYYENPQNKPAVFYIPDGRYQVNEYFGNSARYQIFGRYPDTTPIPKNLGFPAHLRYPTMEKQINVGWYPVNQMQPIYEKGPGVLVYPESVKSPVNEVPQKILRTNEMEFAMRPQRPIQND